MALSPVRVVSNSVRERSVERCVVSPSPFHFSLEFLFWTGHGNDTGGPLHLDWTNNWRGKSKHPFGGGQRRVRRDPRRVTMLAISVFATVVVALVVYLLFFHIYNVGQRAIAVNGERVESMDAFSVHRTTWLSRSQAVRFIQRIHASGVTLPPGRKTYHGVSYIRTSDLVAVLTQHGDNSAFVNGELTVHLKPGQHYSYALNGDLIRQQEIWVRGQLIERVLTVYHDEADYLPVAEIVDGLKRSNVPSAWTGKVLDVDLTGNAGTPPIMTPADYTLIRFGKGQAVYAPLYDWQRMTYLPSLSIGAVLRQLGYTSTSGQWRWTVSSPASHASDSQTAGQETIPAAMKPSKPEVLGFVPFYFGDLASFEDVMRNPTAYNALAEDIWTVDSSGQLSGSVPAGAASQAAAAGDDVYAMITNLGASGADTKAMAAILNPTSSRRMSTEIVSLVDTEGFDGAMLDFESIPASYRTAYTKFVTRLAADLHAHGKRLEVVVPPDTGSANEPWNGAYDQARLGQEADAIIVMAYDYSYAGGPAGPIAPLPWVQETLAYTVSRVPANKVLLGLDVYGYDWAGKQTIAVGLPSVDSFLAQHHIKPNWDKAAEAPWFKWTDLAGVVHTVYYENAESTSAKLALTDAYGVTGVAVWRAGLEDSEVLHVLSKYAQGGIQ